MNGYTLARQISQKALYIKTNLVSDTGFSYIRYRILRPFLKLYYRLYRQRHEFSPWTSPASIDFFNNYLTIEMSGFEFGSGKSTIFYAQRLKNLISIEHNEGWYFKVKEWLLPYSNVTYKFIPQSQSDHLNQYSSFICEYPNETFDFIMIDGRERIKCLENSIPKLKRGGILILDNSERKRYCKAFDLLKDWRMVMTTTGLTDTTIWFKP